MSTTLESVLAQELISFEGIHGQDPETGANIDSGRTYISSYTNRIFGSPFQFLDSVDRRFDSINTQLGANYLKNTLLNSPILYIRPGLPKYTGGTDGNSLFEGIKSVFFNTGEDLSFTESLLETLAANTLFAKGSKLQKRMFGFRETYYQYMQHVNYMCRSMAVFLDLTETGNDYPNGCFIDSVFHEFGNMSWENYRMMSGSKVLKPWDQLVSMGGATILGATLKSGVDIAKSIPSSIYDMVMGAFEDGTDSVDPKDAANAFSSILENGVSLTDLGNLFGDSSSSTIDGSTDSTGTEVATETDSSTSVGQQVADNYSTAINTSITEVMVDKVSSVQFMVDPVSFEETLTNETAPSAIESTIDAINEGVGQEIAFITGSNVDLGLLGNVTSFLGDTVSTAANFISGLVEPISGGFMTNLFSGAVNSIKGQKMIYPEIYKKSNSSMNYQFTVNLVSPYGDIYNYYMNIVVPLMHLIALAAPRMVTANSVTSPFLVQAFIPGICTCQMGIIENMQISKNKSNHSVSVNGFPLEVSVTFTIKELYNAMSISPANDPASFLFNETLNDYMANLGGLMPSVDTYKKQRAAMFSGLENFFSEGEWWNDIGNNILTGIEDFINPFAAQG